MKADGFTDAVVLGMGGSSLAPEVLRQSIAEHLREDAGWPRLHVLDTHGSRRPFSRSASAIDPARTLFFVSSKSGTTIEALSLFAYFHELVERAKPGRAGENFVAITDAGTPLQALADEHRFRRRFTNPGDIGGRYSALSYFGLVPAAVAGVDVARLLDRGIAAASGTRDADSDALQPRRGPRRAGARRPRQVHLHRRRRRSRVRPLGRAADRGEHGQTGPRHPARRGEPLGTPRHYGDDRLFIQLRLDGAATRRRRRVRWRARRRRASQ